MGLLSFLFVSPGPDSARRPPPRTAALSTPGAAWPVPKAYVTSLDVAQSSKQKQRNETAKGVCPLPCTLPHSLDSEGTPHRDLYPLLSFSLGPASPGRQVGASGPAGALIQRTSQGPGLPPPPTWMTEQRLTDFSDSSPFSGLHLVGLL